MKFILAFLDKFGRGEREGKGESLERKKKKSQTLQSRKLILGVNWPVNKGCFSPICVQQYVERERARARD